MLGSWDDSKQAVGDGDRELKIFLLFAANQPFQLWQ
jgi:hypothetical protein